MNVQGMAAAALTNVGYKVNTFTASTDTVEVFEATNGYAVVRVEAKGDGAVEVQHRVLDSWKIQAATIKTTTRRSWQGIVKEAIKALGPISTEGTLS